MTRADEATGRHGSLIESTVAAAVDHHEPCQHDHGCCVPRRPNHLRLVSRAHLFTAMTCLPCCCKHDRQAHTFDDYRCHVCGVSGSLSNDTVWRLRMLLWRHRILIVAPLGRAVRVTMPTPCDGARCRELCNECHTSDNYEKNLGTTPGELLYNWQASHPTHNYLVYDFALPVKATRPSATSAVILRSFAGRLAALACRAAHCCPPSVASFVRLI